MMMMMAKRLLVLILLGCSVFTDLGPLGVRSASPHHHPSLLGVSPQDEKYYDGSAGFVGCRDGSKKINRSRINDDFCDCVDGSDEPGTSACPNGRFYCRNIGHIPVVLFSSRVNDGICDCCDGSDEYDGKVTCPNTCWEAGKAARDKLKKKIATYQEGVTLRKKEVEQAKAAYEKDQAELSKLKSEAKILKDLVEELQERKDQIEEAEEKERLEKENEEKIRQETEKGPDLDKKDVEEAEKVEEEPDHNTDDKSNDNVEHSSDKVGEVYDDSEDDNGVSSSPVGESPSDMVELPFEANNDELEAVSADDAEREEENTLSENLEILSKEELGRLVASRWTGETAGQKAGEPSSLKDSDDLEEAQSDVHHEEDQGYHPEADEDGDGVGDEDDDEEEEDEDEDEDDNNDNHFDHNVENHVDTNFAVEDNGDFDSSYDEDHEDESDVNASGNLSWLEILSKKVKSLLHSVNLFQTPVNISDAARVRKEYAESSAKLSKLQSRISSLSKKLKQDFGPDKEFYSFYDRCFEGKENKYVYKVCPYKQATQNEGHSTTRLGKWEKVDESYKVMLFSSGDKCWNGPERSLKVKLRCGLENAIADVDEPSRCEYVALFSTPNVCTEEKLKELQEKLDALNKEQPQIHDEL
ncbi:Glucosidase 2 subunit beta-like protein [Drosera capensis]